MKFRPLGSLPLVNATAIILTLMICFVLFGTKGALSQATESMFRQVAEQKIRLAARALLATPFLQENSSFIREPVRLQPVLIDRESTLVYRDGAGRWTQFPDACYLVYDARERRQRMEVCAAFTEEPGWIYLAVDYCGAAPMAQHKLETSPASGEHLVLTLSNSANQSEPVAQWLLVTQPAASNRADDNDPLSVVTAYALTDPKHWSTPGAASVADFVVDKRFRGETWSHVPASTRCRDAASKTKQRIRMRICGVQQDLDKSHTSLSLANTCAPDEKLQSRSLSESFADWARSLVFDLRLANRQGSVVGTGDAVTARHGLYEAIDQLVVAGETLRIGQVCDEATARICHAQITSSMAFSGAAPPGSGQSMFPAHSFLGELKQWIVTSLAEAAAPQARQFCQRLVERPRTAVCYEWDPRLEHAALMGFIDDLLPFLGIMIAATMLAGVVVYVGLGVRVRRFVAGMRNLRHAHDVDALKAQAIPYRNSHHELGYIARTVAELVQEVSESADKQRAIAEERAQMLIEREEQIQHELKINRIIAHEIRTPVHELAGRIVADPDILRILTALDAIDRIEDIREMREPATEVELNAYVMSYAQSKVGRPLNIVSNVAPVRALLRPQLTYLALDNLVENAERFRADSTSIELVVEVAKDGGAPCIYVRNHGPVIPVEWLEGIFRIGHSDNTNATRRSSRNRGLGLFISRHYMLLQGGALDALPSITGAVFRLTFSRPLA